MQHRGMLLRLGRKCRQPPRDRPMLFFRSEILWKCCIVVGNLHSQVTYLIYKIGRYVAGFAILVSVAYILRYYNDSGNLRDAGVYFESGIAVLKGENPYPGSRWGSFGPVPFAIVLSAIPDAIQSVAIRILSLAGIYAFARILYPNKRLLEPFAITFVLLWLSPVRELMATNQMSGIAIGLLALGVKFLENFTTFRNITKETVAGALFFAMALDLKPHICVVFFLSWAVYKKSLSKFIVVSLTLVITHLAINISQMRFLELDWLKALSGLSESASKNSLGDSVSFWPILNHIVDAPSFFYFASILGTSALTGLCLYWAYKGKWEEVMILSFFIPSVFIYYHYYDAVPLCVIFVMTLFRINHLFPIAFAVSFILIPKEYMNLRNQLLILLIVGFFVLRKALLDKNLKFKAIFVPALLGLAASTILRLINTKLELSDHLLQSLIVTQSIVIIVLLSIYANIKKIQVS